MDCPFCGQENAQSANFCHNCGHLLSDQCPRCHTPLGTPTNFCTHCGLPLSPLVQGSWWTAEFLDRIAPTPQASPVVSRFLKPAADHPVQTSKVDGEDTADRQRELDRFLPRELAQKLEAARSSGTMVGERRVVSMLFCDIQGSTAAAEKLDPEEWTDIINGAFEYMIKPVYKYEGTVARLMGDAILAFFGAPIAHEDDPQRAVLSGLEIVAGFQAYQEETMKRVGFKISVRVGINTGLVVVGAVGSDRRMEYTAMGDAINMAARMEQTAEPGTVQIAEPTYKLVKRLFDFEALEPVSIKGKAEPVSAYRVLGRQAIQQNLRGIEGMRAPLIGRDREMSVLREIMDRTQQGLGRIVLLTGEAGLGKSRLIEEAQQYWQNAGYGNTWQNVVSFSYETNHAYGLFQRLVRRLINISAVDLPSVLRQKLDPLITPFPEARRPRVMQIFETLFSLENESDRPALEGEQFQQELFIVMLQIWKQLFHDQPAVVVFDDLHWSDPASVELVTHLLAATDTISLVIICSFRPDPDGSSGALQTAARNDFAHRTTEIHLNPLANEDINAVLDALLPGANLPEKMRLGILDRAGGNPFFVEEVVRSLVLNHILVNEAMLDNDGAQPVWRVVDGAHLASIPDNLQSLLAARIDRLESDIKATLQLASVIGRSFFERILTEMAAHTHIDSAQMMHNLHQLLQLQMIQEMARLPEIEYIFRNPLTQEVAYNGILLKRRREYHLWVAQAMESLYVDQLGDLAPRLAYHFQEAGLVDKSFQYFVRAGGQARRLYAHQEALAHYDQALQLVDQAHPESDQTIQLYMERGRVLEHSGQFNEAAGTYEALEKMGQSQNDQGMRLEALIALGTLRSMQTPLYDSGIAWRLAEEGLALAQALNQKSAEAKIYWNMTMVARYRNEKGDTELAVRYGEKSLELARELNLKEQMALTLNDLASLYRNAARFADADKAGQEARALLRELGNLPMLADSYAQASFYFTYFGRFIEAEESALEAKKISEEIGNSWNLATTAEVLGLLEMERGHYDNAFAIFTSAIARPEIAQITFIHALIKTRMMELYIEVGDLSRAQALIQENLTAVHFGPYFAAIINALKNRVLLLKNPDQASKADLRPTPPQPESAQLAFYESYDRQYQNELALILGEFTQAIQKSEEALAIYERFGLRNNLPLYGLLLARGLWQGGEQDGARKALRNAEEVAREIGNRRLLWPILVQKVGWETDGDVALHYQGEANEVIGYIADHAGELRDSFLNRPEIRKFFELSTQI